MAKEVQETLSDFLSTQLSASAVFSHINEQTGKCRLINGPVMESYFGLVRVIGVSMSGIVSCPIRTCCWNRRQRIVNMNTKKARKMETDPADRLLVSPARLAPE